MLLLINSHSSFLTLINIYSRLTFVPSLDTVGAKLRILEIIIAFSLEESIATTILTPLSLSTNSICIFVVATFEPSLGIIGSQLRP